MKKFKIVLIAMVALVMVLSSTSVAFAGDGYGDRWPDDFGTDGPSGSHLLKYACATTPDGESFDGYWYSTDPTIRVTDEDFISFMAMQVAMYEYYGWEYSFARCEALNRSSTTDMVAGAEMTAFLGSCTVNTQVALYDGTLAMYKLPKSGRGWPNFFTEPCGITADGQFGDYTSIIYTLNSLTYNQYLKGKAELQYTADGETWETCGAVLSGVDLENKVYGTLSCSLMGPVAGFGLVRP